MANSTAIHIPAWITAVLAGLMILVAFLPLRHADYVQDDHLVVEQNAIVARGDPAEIFSTSYWAGADGDDRSLYRPVAILSYALERGTNAAPDPLLSHRINLGLHLLATLGLFVLVRRLGFGDVAATATTLLFAVHPVHVEALANIVGRAEILATLFSIAALWLLTYTGPWGDRPSPAGWRPRAAAWGAAAATFLALGAKEVALALPLLMVLLEWRLRPGRPAWTARRWIDRSAALAPSALAALLYLGLRVRAIEMLVSLQPAHPMDNLLVQLDGPARFGTALALVPRYARLLFFPIRLSADYSGPAVTAESSPLAFLPLAGALLLGLVLALMLRPLFSPEIRSSALPSPRELAGFSAALLLLPYFVIGNLLFSIGTVMAERLLYLPSAGWCMLLGLALGRLAGLTGPLGQRPRQVFAILGIVVAAFGVRSWSRSIDWRNDETVFSAAIRAQPRAARSHFIVASLAGDRGETEAALLGLERTLELYPEYVAARFEKGVLLGSGGRLEESITAFQEVVRLRPDYPEGQLNLGLALRRVGRLGEAERALRVALVFNPELAKAWAELGNLYLDSGRPAAAARAYREAIALGRDDLLPRLRAAERAVLDARGP